MVTISSLDVFIQVIINGTLYGCIYGLAAIGLSLIFGSMQIIFIAQGAMMVLASYFTYWFFTLTSIDPLLCFILLLPVFYALGAIIYRVCFKRVARAGKNPTLLLAFGIMVLFERAMALLWSPDTRSVTTDYTTMSLSLGNINISYIRLLVFVIGIAATIIVFLFLKKTMWGKAVRGSSEDPHAAALLGISPVKVATLTFAIGISLAGVAGVAVAMSYPFDPYFGFIFSLKALVAVAIGGMGSVGGAFIGGVLLGLFESLGSYLISSGWADAISYAIFLIVLIFFPEGLFGRSAKKV
ncbi:MAG: branched-chain amino acid ABC transporter permease [Desulfobacteraceae bacterium]|nr:branched-chain amino acid ABC transporter permease [Desulfobacteraceae bacterium]